MNVAVFIHWFGSILHLWHYSAFGFVILFFGRWNNADRPRLKPRCGSDGPAAWALTVSGQYSQEKRVSSSWCPFWCRLCLDLTCLSLSPVSLRSHETRLLNRTGEWIRTAYNEPPLDLPNNYKSASLRIVDKRPGFSAVLKLHRAMMADVRF